MVITDFIIHKIDKKAQETPTLHLRKTSLKVSDPKVIKFMEETVAFFSNRQDRPNTVFAPFHEDVDEYPLSRHCAGFFGGTLPFLDFSHKAASRLHQRMSSQPLATGGYFVVASYTQGEERKLLIVMIHHQSGFSVDDATLDLVDVTHLDLKEIDKAALVDGGKPDGPAPEKPLTYAGFRKSLSLYFQQFLGPDRFRNPNKDSQELILAVDQYCESKAFDQSTCDVLRKTLREYIKTQADANEEVELTSVSAIVNANAPDDFSKFATKRKISAAFRADPTPFKKWRIIRHKSPDGVTVQFPAEVLGRRILLDADKKTLTIKDLEPAFIASIKKSAGVSG